MQHFNAAAPFLRLLVPVSLERVLHRKRFASLLGGAVGVVLVLLATWIAHGLHLNLAAAGFIQLLAVLAVALRVGFLQATIASVVANCCLNYFFIPPVFTFSVADAQNWVALIVFEVSALIVSRLSTEAQTQAARAKCREITLGRLYEMSGQLLLMEPDKPPAPQVLSLIERVFSTKAAVLFDASEATAESIGADAAQLEAAARAAYLHDRDPPTRDGRTWVRILRVGVRSMGALALRGDELTAATVSALASLTAIALERARSFERASRAEAERQSEQLRTVVLDSLAHQYKTPLTVIRAATSGLIEMGQLTDVQSELMRLIDSETMRLNELTTRLLVTSRLGQADIPFRPEHMDVDALIEAVVLSASEALSAHRVHIERINAKVSIRADRELLATALTQFLDNAAKYSDPTSAITIAAQVSAGEIRIAVHNQGPYIPFDTRERIFQRFYRSPDASFKAAGTGIGLSISKKVAELHGGRVWVTSDEGSGNTFFLALPRSQERRT